MRRLRGFTLIELIVVILVLGMLAALAVVGYTQVTDRGQGARAQTNLRNLAMAVMVDATLEGARTLDRPLVLGALDAHMGVDVVDGLDAAATWVVGGAQDAPAVLDEFAVGFDDGDRVPQDTGGCRAAAVTWAGGASYARIIALPPCVGDGTAGQVPDGTTPADVLADPTIVVPVLDGGSVTPPAPGVVDLNVSAYPGDRTATIRWDAAPGATGYTVVLVPANGGTPVSAPAATSPATISSLVNGTVYMATVTAHLPGGQTTVSDPVAVVPSPAPSAEAAAAGSPLWFDAGGFAGHFGADVAIDGSTAVVSALSTSLNSWRGRAYVFEKQGAGWVYTQELIPAAGREVSRYAAAQVAISGDTILVSASEHTGGGLVYVYTKTAGTWSEQAQLSSPGATFFGSRVAIDGDLVLVSAVDATTVPGTVYPFTRTGTTWSPEAPIQASAPAAYDGFGTGLAIDSTTAVIGAPDMPSGDAVYVLTRAAGRWSIATTLTPANPAADDAYGYAVDIDGRTVVVGAPSVARATDAAYVYTGTGATWSLQAKLPTPTSSVMFGSTVAVDGDLVAVGDYQFAGESGRALGYTRSGGTWTLTTGWALGKWSGSSVDISGADVIVGAPKAVAVVGWQNILDAGKAAVFQWRP